MPAVKQRVTLRRSSSRWLSGSRVVVALAGNALLLVVGVVVVDGRFSKLFLPKLQPIPVSKHIRSNSAEVKTFFFFFVFLPLFESLFWFFSSAIGKIFWFERTELLGSSIAVSISWIIGSIVEISGVSSVVSTIFMFIVISVGFTFFELFIISIFSFIMSSSAIIMVSSSCSSSRPKSLCVVVVLGIVTVVLEVVVVIVVAVEVVVLVVLVVVVVAVVVVVGVVVLVVIVVSRKPAMTWLRLAARPGWERGSSSGLETLWSAISRCMFSSESEQNLFQ